MKGKIITIISTIILFGAFIPALAQKEDNGKHQLSGFKKFNVREAGLPYSIYIGKVVNAWKK